MKKTDPNEALTKAGEMMGTPQNQLPKEAMEFVHYTSSKIGICGEVFITCFAVYNQVVLGMSCNDSLYQAREEDRQWFIDKGYCK